MSEAIIVNVSGADQPALATDEELADREAVCRRAEEARVVVPATTAPSALPTGRT